MYLTNVKTCAIKFFQKSISIIIFIVFLYQFIVVTVNYLKFEQVAEVNLVNLKAFPAITLCTKNYNQTDILNNQAKSIRCKYFHGYATNITNINCPRPELVRFVSDKI